MPRLVKIAKKTKPFFKLNWKLERFASVYVVYVTPIIDNHDSLVTFIFKMHADMKFIKDSYIFKIDPQKFSEQCKIGSHRAELLNWVTSHKA